MSKHFATLTPNNRQWHECKQYMEAVLSPVVPDVLEQVEGLL